MFLQIKARVILLRQVRFLRGMKASYKPPTIFQSQERPQLTFPRLSYSETAPYWTTQRYEGFERYLRSTRTAGDPGGLKRRSENDVGVWRLAGVMVEVLVTPQMGVETGNRTGRLKGYLTQQGRNCHTPIECMREKKSWWTVRNCRGPLLQSLQQMAIWSCRSGLSCIRDKSDVGARIVEGISVCHSSLDCFLERELGTPKS